MIPSNECYTPAYFIDPIREFANGFSLDPFSSRLANETVKADKFFTKESDALSFDWFNDETETIWCNPPYSRFLIGACVTKFLNSKDGAESFLLLNSSTCSKTYHAAFEQCDAILFPRKRIQFFNPYLENRSSNEYDQTLFYYGVRGGDFVGHMDDLCGGMAETRHVTRVYAK